MKKFMFYLMAFDLLISSIIMAVTLAVGGSSLPALTLGLRGGLMVLGAALIVKRYLSWVRRGEIVAYYAASGAAAVFNLVYLSTVFPVEVRAFELALTGTLVTPVLNTALILLLFKMPSRYAVFENLGDPKESVSPARLSGETVKQN